MYVRPEIPGITKRITVALLSCMGFIIMFGMRTIMGMVKLEIKVSFCFFGVMRKLFKVRFIGTRK